MEKKYDSTLSITKQREYVKKNNMPQFAPRNGICWKCDKNIYEEVHWKKDRFYRFSICEKNDPNYSHSTGITIEEANTELVTGCPHCNISYCD